MLEWDGASINNHIWLITLRIKLLNEPNPAQQVDFHRDLKISHFHQWPVTNTFIEHMPMIQSLVDIK